MSIIRGQLIEDAVVFNIDTSQATSSSQPIETLVETGLIYKCKFKPKKTFFYYLTGQVQTTDNIIVTERKVLLNNVLEIDDIKYRIISVTALKSPGARGRKIIGYSS